MWRWVVEAGNGTKYQVKGEILEVKLRDPQQVVTREQGRLPRVLCYGNDDETAGLELLQQRVRIVSEGCLSSFLASMACVWTAMQMKLGAGIEVLVAGVR